jgi:hypothetical protein
VTYRSSTAEIESKFIKLGIIISKILNHYTEDFTEPIGVLRKVFYQQFEVVNHEVTVLPQEKLPPSRIESPHDTDCRFRKKGDQKQRGYFINITETCNPENPVNLVTDAQVEPASVSDNTFLIPAVEASQELLSDEIETINVDGAFHSVGNQNYCKEQDIDLVLSALCAPASRLDHSVDEEGNLICFDTQTGTNLETRKVKPKTENEPPKWAVYMPGLKKPRIINQHAVDICMLRKQIAARTKEELNLRANVEATIFQLGYHYRANKSRYRGLIKHRIWANIRCMWINFVRIMKYITSLEPPCEDMCPNTVYSINKCVLYAKNMLINAIFSFEQIFKRCVTVASPKFGKMTLSGKWAF